MTETADNQPDRRANTRLRDIFDEGFALLGPFFDPDNTWGGQSLDHLAFRVMREKYPDLSQGEVHVFVTAAKRIYAAKHSSGS